MSINDPGSVMGMTIAPPDPGLTNPLLREQFVSGVGGKLYGGRNVGLAEADEGVR